MHLHRYEIDPFRKYFDEKALESFRDPIRKRSGERRRVAGRRARLARGSRELIGREAALKRSMTTNGLGSISLNFDC